MPRAAEDGRRPGRRTSSGARDVDHGGELLSQAIRRAEVEPHHLLGLARQRLARGSPAPRARRPEVPIPGYGMPGKVVAEVVSRSSPRSSAPLAPTQSSVASIPPRAILTPCPPSAATACTDSTATPRAAARLPLAARHGPSRARSLSIAHMDCDAFFAAVEKRDNPDLRDRPVIVGGGAARRRLHRLLPRPHPRRPLGHADVRGRCASAPRPSSSSPASPPMSRPPAPSAP
jgi:hypothetical protein